MKFIRDPFCDCPHLNITSWLIHRSGVIELPHSAGISVSFRAITELSKVHEGKTFKVYLGITPIVGIHSPDAVQAVLTGKLKSDKPFFYKFLKPWLGHRSLLMM
ncbi:hypothetical protein HPB49_007242 [Dermacentor silvarum]|uniref:Uncharacterized protein n=1 Tax=Dermacentor silvarum TaxID=543639 RepID=A0ACB8DWT6_DERSI|nr:hypothetical protein HPB49_007242 [Dermacentor silvarum]